MMLDGAVVFGAVPPVTVRFLGPYPLAVARPVGRTAPWPSQVSVSRARRPSSH